MVILCKKLTCHKEVKVDGSYCWDCSISDEYLEEHEGTFSQKVNEFETKVNNRFKALEADVKRLKRELGLK